MSKLSDNAKLQAVVRMRRAFIGTILDKPAQVAHERVVAAMAKGRR